VRDAACYRRGVRRLLVLWDIDFTLIGASGVGTRLYEMVFRDMFGRELPGIAPMAGRTDRAIIRETLATAGIGEPRAHLDEFIARLAALAPAGRELAAGRSQALPGAAAALAALARYTPGAANAPHGGPGEADAGSRSGTDSGTAEHGETGADGRSAAHGGTPLPGEAGADGRAPLWVVQSVLTGNVWPIAEVKLTAAGLAGYLDLDAGAYGESHEVRAELVHLARANAARRYGADFAGEQTVLVGDTALDVAAALATGARVVGVATGGTSAAELAAAGASAVLPGLSDTAATLAAILGAAIPEGEAAAGGPAGANGPPDTDGQSEAASAGPAGAGPASPGGPMGTSGPEPAAGLPDQR
jgi:phosphoglycolate phosphatase-like HAD superfamily hydrolase